VRRSITAVLAGTALTAVAVVTLPSSGAMALAANAVGPHRLVTVTAADLVTPQAQIDQASGETCDAVAAPAWCVSTVDTGTVGIVVEPHGRGVLEFRTPGASDKATVSTAVAMPLSDVGTASYDTFTAGPGNQVPTLFFTLTNADPDVQYTTLVFEPAYVPLSVTPGAWQEWDAASQSGWWSTADEVPVYTTLALMQQKYPHAAITRVGLNQGTGNAGAVGLADAAAVNGTTFDFQPVASTRAVVDALSAPRADGSCATWCVTKTDTATVTLTNDPTAPTASALQLSTPETADEVSVFTSPAKVVSTIHTLAYQTSRGEAGGAGIVPALRLIITRPGEADTELVWEPVYAAGAVNDISTDGSWQAWVPSTGSGWWSPQNTSSIPLRGMAYTGETGSLGFPQYTATWIDVQRVLGAATVSRLGLGQGTGNAGLVAKTDALLVDETWADFQVPAPTAPDVDPTVPATPTVSPSVPATPTVSPSVPATPMVSPSVPPPPTVSPSVPNPDPPNPGDQLPPDPLATSDSGAGGGTGGGGAGGPASQSPSPRQTVKGSPTATASSGAAQPVALRLSLDRVVTTPGNIVTLAVHGTPNEAVQVMAYSRPQSQYAVVRDGFTDDRGNATFQVSPGTNTRLYVRYAVLTADTDSPSQVIQVRTALSLSAYRDGVRQYHFQGTNLPRLSGQLITLYRVTADGREVRTATTKTNSSGVWRIDRTFSGSGRYTFVVRTSKNLNNAAGVSNRRVVAVY
jgi:hypothetical protein